MNRIVFWSMAICLWLPSMVLADESALTIANSHQFERELPATDGRSVSLRPQAGVSFRVLCFLGTECPLAKIYGPRLQRMSDRYQDQGIEFYGINSNIQDSMEDLRSFVELHQLRFPVVKDHDRSVALGLGASRTPEVFVLDQGGRIRYQGRIDDQYQPGVARAEATQHDLADAIDQLLAGTLEGNRRTQAVGCLIALPKSKPQTVSDPKVTYCNQVSRIFQDHCIECHRNGEIGPFALDEYDEAIGWADMAMEVIDQGRMPPWHADPNHGQFANARQMSDEAKEMLREWVATGTPYGDAADLPPEKQFISGWDLPQPPDAEFAISDQPFQVPASGVIEYQYFVIDPHFEEDKWVRAVQVVPGNRGVVHHCIAFTRPPDGADFRDIGMLSAYVPGQKAGVLPEGYAQRIPAHSKIVFQVHYTPTGKPETDLTKIGLIFASAESVTHEVYAMGGIEQEFEIPPHTPRYEIDGAIRGLPRDGFLLSIIPHMHLRGKSFSLDVDRGESSKTLLNVPHYDFNWQHSYDLVEPLPLRDVQSLNFSVVFDNSTENPFNPNPDEYVTWGDQTWQEMAVTFISVARPIRADPGPKQESMLAIQAKHQAKREKLREAASQYANDYIARHDKNGDGTLTLRELPLAVQRFGYMDHDQDGIISREEVLSEAAARLESQL